MGCVHGKCCCHYPSSSDERNGPIDKLRNKHILTQYSLGFASVPSHNFNLQYSFLSQRGYYPNTPDRENADSLCIRTKIQGNPNLHFFGVFDGHGESGDKCAKFASSRLVDVLSNDPGLLDDPFRAYNDAFATANSELLNSEIDDSMSGTTAITVLVSGDKLFVGNVGDSRAVIGIRSGNRVLAEDLSSDQTPFRKDELERVKLCGARVLTFSQIEGRADPDIQEWGDEESNQGDPPRVWVQDGLYPGTAFTRSVGDSVAEKIGVTSVPEVSAIQLTPNHMFFVIASDGVFEFLSSQDVVNMVVEFTDPRDACSAIAAESYKLWLQNDVRTDDITIIVVHIKDLRNSGAAATSGMSK